MLHAYHFTKSGFFFKKKRGGPSGTRKHAYSNVLTARIHLWLGVFEQVHTCSCHFAAAYAPFYNTCADLNGGRGGGGGGESPVSDMH